MNSIEVLVPDPSAVSLARREAAALAARLGMDEVGAGQVALVASELASNLVKHGGGGRLLLSASGSGVDLLALDTGKGMPDVAACMADGYSTAGNGLGAARRLSSRFEIASWPGRGSAVQAHVGPDDAADDTTAAVMVTKPGEVACGDGWALHEGAAQRTLMMVDGLGHGTEAAVAAREALALFAKWGGEPPAELVQRLHLGLRHTRGGAVAVARVQWASHTIAFAGLGNIAAAVVAPDGSARRMVSHNGTAGHNARKIQAFDYPFGPQSLLVMHTDGMGGHWSLQGYPGLARAHPALVAGVLYRDQARGRDDTTVVVTRLEQP